MYFISVLYKIVKMFVKLLKNVTGFGKTKMVIVVRTDFKMSQGKVASQCAHAAVSLFDSALKSADTELVKLWLNRGQPKIVLKVDKDCENVIRKLYEEAKNKGLNACLVYDAGKTQIERGSLTVLGIGPNLTTDIDDLTSHLKLL